MLRGFTLKRLAVTASVMLASALIFYGCNNPANGKDDDGPDVDGKTVAEILDEGHSLLAKHDYDAAIAYYEAAYKADGNSSEAILYSSLAKMAGISVDPLVGKLFRERLGFTEYPTKLNALLSTDWMVATPSYSFDWYYYDETVSEFVEWFDQWDVNNGWADGVDKIGYYYYDRDSRSYIFVTDERRYERHFVWSYYDDGWVYWFDEWDVDWYDLTKVGYYRVERERVCDTDAWGEYCWYDMVPTTFVTDVQRDPALPGLSNVSWIGGSGSLYNGTLVNDAPTVETWAILMFANLIDKNQSGLNNLIDGLHGAVFGASFNDIVARVEKMKGKAPIKLSGAFLESIGLGDIYDEFDPIGWAEANVVVSFMTAIKASIEWIAAYDWNTDLNILMFAWPEDGDAMEAAVFERLKAASVNSLPFGNNFLKPRQGGVGGMDKSKASFIAAIDGLIASYDAFLDDGRYPQVVSELLTLRQGAAQLRNAIQNGGTFYIPDDPTRGGWPTSGDGINMGKFFEPGFFSLQNLFDVDASGMPLFYTADGELLTPGNYEELLSSDGWAGLRFMATRLEELIVFENAEFYDEILFLPERYARLLFEKYNGLNLTKRPEQRLAKARRSRG